MPLTLPPTMGHLPKNRPQEGLGHKRDTAYMRKKCTQPSLPRERAQKLPERADSKDEISSQRHLWLLLNKDI